MTWKDIVKEDLREKVIEALIPFYESREEVIESNIMGRPPNYGRYKGNPQLRPPFTKEDVKDLLEELIQFPFNFSDEDDKNYKEAIKRLKQLIR